MKDRRDLLHLLEGDKASVRHFTVLKKEGQSILYLPRGRKMADATLRLYPAQSLLARSLVGLARGFMRFGIPVSMEEASFPVDDQTSFSEFLKRTVAGSKTIPDFGIFENRIKESGRPYVLLLFTAAGHPSVVVKVGTTEKARALIRVEQNLFFPKRPNYPCLPEALDVYEGTMASAIAYRYVEGAPPKPRQHREIATLMNSWIRDGETVRIHELPVWDKLKILLSHNQGLEPLFEFLQSRVIKPVLSHGDFAPWNIRVSNSGADDKWTVLDWERGDSQGIPAWDWFNFIVQFHTWVQHLSPSDTLLEVEALWENPSFQAYAKRTGIEAMVKELTFAYLLYSLHYCNPEVKSARLRLLVREFNRKYFPSIVLSTSSLTISVITPSYKQLPWLKLCAASVTDQRGVTIQHIIQDAQSGPELDEWVRQNTHAELHVECDSGMYDAINRGFARASGDIVCWLNSDEQYLEGTLAKVADYFETHPDIDVLFGDALLISNAGAVLSYRHMILPNLQHVQAVHLNTLSCATFFRRSVIDRGFKLDTQWKTIADAVLVADLLKAGISMAVMNEPLAAFTITDSNLGQSGIARAETLRWRTETASGNLLYRLSLTGWHRMAKLLYGAYWPRSVSTRLYTVESPQKRVIREARHVDFRWYNAGSRNLLKAN